MRMAKAIFWSTVIALASILSHQANGVLLTNDVSRDLSVVASGIWHAVQTAIQTGIVAGDQYAPGLVTSVLEDIAPGRKVLVRLIVWSSVCSYSSTNELFSGSDLQQRFQSAFDAPDENGQTFNKLVNLGYNWATCVVENIVLDYTLVTSRGSSTQSSSLRGLGSMLPNTTTYLNQIKPRGSKGHLPPRIKPITKVAASCPYNYDSLVSEDIGPWREMDSTRELYSPNGQYMATIDQNSCILYVLDTSSNAVLWGSNSDGRGSGCFVRMQLDGNMVLYNNLGNAVCSTGTSYSVSKNVESYRLTMQNDGNLVVYWMRPDDQALHPIWASKFSAFLC